MVSLRSDVRYPEGYGPSDNYANELHVSPDLAPMEPSFEVRPRRARIRRVSHFGNRRSVGREVFRLFVYGLIIITIAGAAFASQYGDDKTKETLRVLERSMSGLSYLLGVNPSAGGIEGVSKILDQGSTQDKTPPKEARLIQSIPAPVSAESSDQIQRQLETMASDLAVVRSLVEQLAASQKQMAQDVAAMETGKENSSYKVWWLSQSAAFPAVPRKSVQKTVPPTAQSSPAPVPTTRPQAH